MQRLNIRASYRSSFDCTTNVGSHEREKSSEFKACGTRFWFYNSSFHSRIIIIIVVSINYYIIFNTISRLLVSLPLSLSFSLSRECSDEYIRPSCIAPHIGFLLLYISARKKIYTRNIYIYREKDSIGNTGLAWRTTIGPEILRVSCTWVRAMHDEKLVNFCLSSAGTNNVSLTMFLSCFCFFCSRIVVKLSANRKTDLIARSITRGIKCAIYHLSRFISEIFMSAPGGETKNRRIHALYVLYTDERIYLALSHWPCCSVDIAIADNILHGCRVFRVSELSRDKRR